MPKTISPSPFLVQNTHIADKFGLNRLWLIFNSFSNRVCIFFFSLNLSRASANHLLYQNEHGGATHVADTARFGSL
jgi:hypothetical protein